MSQRWKQRCRAAALVGVLVVPIHGFGEDRPAAATVQPAMTAAERWTPLLESSARRLKADPDDLQALSQHGDASLFLGRADDAVRDYDRVIALRPERANSHWQRGIALYYASRFERAARQFDAYHEIDQVDRENGLWKYLSVRAGQGKEAARKTLLRYEKDDRPPFREIYQLLSEETTGPALLKKIEADVPAATRPAQRFYARLYLGLLAASEGDDAGAAEHLRKAADSPWPAAAGYGPDFMQQVAALHLARLDGKKKASGNQVPPADH